MTQVGVCPVLLVEPVLPLYHHTQVLVVHDEALDIQFLYKDGGQLLAVHEEAAIAINVYHHLQYIKTVILKADLVESGLKREG